MPIAHKLLAAAKSHYTSQHAVAENDFSVNHPSYPPNDFSVNHPSYPPNHQRYPSDPRQLGARTPSPTPSEQEALTEPNKRMLNIRKYLGDPKYWPYVAIVAVLIVAGLLLAIYNNQIIKAMKPVTNWLHNHKFGPVIALAAIVILTIPPLWGADLVALLCGITWGAGRGFAIVAAGTIVGEILNYTMFKHFCTARAAKMEKHSIAHSVLARIVRDGGFLVALIVRYSAIPPHYATVVFATSGMPFTTFAAAALLSLPKQFFHVYAGVLSSETNPSQWSKRLGVIIVVVSIVVTVLAMKFIKMKRSEVTPIIVYERQKARQAKLAGFSTIVNPAVPHPKRATRNAQDTIPDMQNSLNAAWNTQPQYQAGSSRVASQTPPQYAFAFSDQSGQSPNRYWPTTK